MSELSKEHRRQYLLSGNATATVVSRVTGMRYTYRVRRPKPMEPVALGTRQLRRGEINLGVHFVSVLTGPENTSSYTFLGTIFLGGAYHHSRKSPVNPDAPSARAFLWLWAHLESDVVQVYHLGACGRCGRPLTTPESIERGLGPVCAGLQ
jgi:hypothetical protein